MIENLLDQPVNKIHKNTYNWPARTADHRASPRRYALRCREAAGYSPLNKQSKLTAGTKRGGRSRRGYVLRVFCQQKLDVPVEQVGIPDVRRLRVALCGGSCGKYRRQPCRTRTDRRGPDDADRCLGDRNRAVGFVEFRRNALGRLQVIRPVRIGPITSLKGGSLPGTHEHKNGLGNLVEPRGIEPLTSALRTLRSPN
jgi:hypothetical protein